MPSLLIRKSPRSKAELLDRLTMSEFTGNLRDLGENAVVRRTKPNVISLFFPETDRTFLLTVHMPRPVTEQAKANRVAAELAPAASTRATKQGRKGARATKH